MLHDAPIVLPPEFTDTLRELEEGRVNYFITGRAGTGKSTLLNLFRKTTKKKVAVLAPTGVAALHVAGQTIHSFFLFPPRLIGSKDIRKLPNARLIRQLDTLIIDEISMVRADLLDAIDQSLRLNRQSTEAFGGVQMVFFGDLFQLPPVLAQQEEKDFLEFHYNSPYFFSAHVLGRSDFQLRSIELSKVFRQEDRHFIRLLESIRNASADADELEELNAYVRPGFEDAAYIRLSARNALVDQINTREMDKLPGKASLFAAEIEGEIKPAQFPADQFLALKEGARVMFLRNDPDLKYVNGTLGTIAALQPDKILVQSGAPGEEKEIEVGMATWEVIRYKAGDPGKPLETEVLGSFKQYPLKPAWAITIHKSQGKTFDKVIVDLGSGAFEHGQTYVALSRCRSLEGLVLSRPLRERDLIMDERIIDFYREMAR